MPYPRSSRCGQEAALRRGGRRLADEARILLGFALSLLAAASITPFAIRVAGRFDFYDHPAGWKEHAGATPYLGGAAVVLGFLVGSVATTLASSELLPIIAGTLVFWIVGTLDDRIGVGPSTRVAIELGAGMLLWAAGLGWSLFDSGLLNMLLSGLWIVTVVNALNLLDLMDGVASSVAAVSAAGAGLLAAVQGNVLLAALALSLSGACLGFLPYNVQRPARIFLGDGGSMPVGFIIGAALMAVPATDDEAWPTLLTAALLFGLPLLDMGFRIVSRRRRGISLLTGGPDSLANQLRRRFPSARVVAAVLAFVQASLCLIALGALETGTAATVVLWATWFGLGTVAVVMLETRSWMPVAPAAAGPPTAAVGPARALGARIVPLEGGLVVFIAASFGISPFLFGYYDVSVWGPIAVALLAGLLGLVIARPATPGRPALVAIGALASLWVWALASTAWAESADQALLDANRWLLYATVFAVLIMILRNDFLCRLMLVACGVAIALFAGYVVARMAVGSAGDLFLGDSLNGPLGYVNGVAGYLLLGVWPFVALAEFVKPRWASAAGMAGAVLIGGLCVLTQTRSVLPAFIVSAVLLLAVVPGRTRRAWTLVFLGAALGSVLPFLLDVSEARAQGGAPPTETLRSAALALVVGSVLAGVAWAALGRLVDGLREGGFGRRRSAVVAASGWTPIAAVVAAGMIALLVAGADPVDKVRSEYNAFVELRADEGGSRFASGNGSRYDYWRVAALEFGGRPFAGVGAGNYDVRYFQERRTAEDIKQPHSLPMQTLAELGIVGGLALVILVGAVAVGFSRRARLARDSPVQRSIVVAAGGLAAVWLLHTSVDWMHLIPGVTGMALCAMAVLVSPWRGGTAHVDRPSVRRHALVLVTAVLVLVGGLSVGRLLLARHFEDQARAALPESPTAALSSANEALALNDESLPAYFAKAAALARMNDYQSAKDALTEATRREPRDFVTWALLGDLATRRGDRALAARYYRRSALLNPRRDTSHRFAGGVDPESPAGTEYQLPLERARSEADAGSAGAGDQAEAPPFGAGVMVAQRRTDEPRGGRSSEPAQAGAAAPQASEDSALLRSVGVVFGILLVGGSLGVAIRRAATARGD